MTGRDEEREAAPRGDARRLLDDGPPTSETLDAWLEETFPASDPPPLWPGRPEPPR